MNFKAIDYNKNRIQNPRRSNHISTPKKDCVEFINIQTTFCLLKGIILYIKRKQTVTKLSWNFLSRVSSN